MNSLIEKLKRSRQSVVEAGGFTFTIRRPTDLEVSEMHGRINARNLIQFVVGWSGVREADLINGGDPHPVEFDVQLAEEWLSDRGDLMSILSPKIIGAYMQTKDRQGESAKN
ncbi:MAG TPA: hypothetical protein VFM48_07480 [Aquabacterium sp.]|nr:hypothetical protein [Aquabacterium sp.]